MIIDAQYQLHLIVPRPEGIYIFMAELVEDGIILDNERFYDTESMFNMEVIHSAYTSAKFDFWWIPNVVFSPSGKKQAFCLATAYKLKQPQVEDFVLQFIDAICHPMDFTF